MVGMQSQNSSEDIHFAFRFSATINGTACLVVASAQPLTAQLVWLSLQRNH
jgi:hypothetical protein